LLNDEERRDFDGRPRREKSLRTCEKERTSFGSASLKARMPPRERRSRADGVAYTSVEEARRRSSSSSVRAGLPTAVPKGRRWSLVFLGAGAVLLGIAGLATLSGLVALVRNAVSSRFFYRIRDAAEDAEEGDSGRARRGGRWASAFHRVGFVPIRETSAEASVRRPSAEVRNLPPSFFDLLDGYDWASSSQAAASSQAPRVFVRRVFVVANNPRAPAATRAYVRSIGAEDGADRSTGSDGTDGGEAPNEADRTDEAATSAEAASSEAASAAGAPREERGTCRSGAAILDPSAPIREDQDAVVALPFMRSSRRTPSSEGPHTARYDSEENLVDGPFEFVDVVIRCNHMSGEPQVSWFANATDVALMRFEDTMKRYSVPVAKTVEALWARPSRRGAAVGGDRRDDPIIDRRDDPIIDRRGEHGSRAAVSPGLEDDRAVSPRDWHGEPGATRTLAIDFDEGEAEVPANEEPTKPTSAGPTAYRPPFYRFTLPEDAHGAVRNRAGGFKQSCMFSYQCDCEYQCELLATLVVSAPSTSALIL